MSEEKPNRTASDVLLSIEAKIDTLLSGMKSLDFSSKLLSNKVSVLETELKKLSVPRVESVGSAPQYQQHTMEQMENQDEVIDPEFFFTQENVPNPVRRNNRGDVGATKKIAKKDKNVGDIVAPMKSPASQSNFKDYDDSLKPGAEVPVQQKVSDQLGKAIFLADVIIQNTQTNKVDKIRTNMIGLWQHTLPVGTYEITITKKELTSANKKQVKQTVVIDGTTIPVKLEEISLK